MALGLHLTLLMTRAELLRHTLSQALRKVHVADKRVKLDEETPAPLPSSN
jgi:hypothetical protein